VVHDNITVSSIPCCTGRINEAPLGSRSKHTDRPGHCYSERSGNGASGPLVDEKKTCFLLYRQQNRLALAGI
jgi:hypothetical protein